MKLWYQLSPIDFGDSRFGTYSPHPYDDILQSSSVNFNRLNVRKVFRWEHHHTSYLLRLISYS